MQRKPGYPHNSCNIKMPEQESSPMGDEEAEPIQRRQQLINFGHTQWGFNNWSWAVTKQDLDFVDYANGKYSVGVVAYVSVTVKVLDIHRENIGYATGLATQKGLAIYKARKCAVTNALRETLLSFGGNVGQELIELDAHKVEYNVQANQSGPQMQNNGVVTTSSSANITEPYQENNQNVANKPVMVAPIKHNIRKDSTDSGGSKDVTNMRPAHAPVGCVAPHIGTKPPPPLIGKTQPMPPAPAPAPLRPNSNVSFVLSPVMPPMYHPPRVPQPHVFPNYYECGPWHYYDGYDRHHGNVNLNFNVPPKNLVVNSRGAECGRPRPPPDEYMQQQAQGCWVKPGIFYDGFWTEQKVKKWVAEQVEKQFPEDAYRKPASPGHANNENKS